MNKLQKAREDQLWLYIEIILEVLLRHISELSAKLENKP